MKKAYGIPLTGNINNCFGICVSEDNEYLGRWTSSDYKWLEKDLENHAEGYDYFFIPEKISYEGLVSLFIQVMDGLKK